MPLVDLGPAPKTENELIDLGPAPIEARPVHYFKKAFGQGMVGRPATAMRGATAYTPGEALGIDPWLVRKSRQYEAEQDPFVKAEVEQAAEGKLWPSEKETPWYDIDTNLLPEVINSWSANVGSQIPIMLMTAVARLISKPVGAVVGVGVATLTAGPDPTDVITMPAVAKVTSKTIEHLGGAAPLIAMEAGYFMDAAEELGLDGDITERYARLYGLGSGAVEYSQWLWNLKAFKNLAVPAKRNIVKGLLMELSGGVWEGLEEMSQQGIENFLLDKAMAEQIERDPAYIVPEKRDSQYGRQFAIGMGVSMLTRMPAHIIHAAARRKVDAAEPKPPVYPEVVAEPEQEAIFKPDIEQLDREVAEIQRGAMEQARPKRPSLPEVAPPTPVTPPPEVATVAPVAEAPAKPAVIPPKPAEAVTERPGEMGKTAIPKGEFGLKWGTGRVKTPNTAPVTQEFSDWYSQVGKIEAKKAGYALSKNWYGEWYVKKTIKPPAAPEAKGKEALAKEKPTPKRPAKAEAVEPTRLIDKYQIVEVPIDKIKLSKEVPNFKEAASRETGVIAGQELQGEYERLGTGAIILWERNNGDLEVITGRHRFELAKRTGEKTIPAQIVHEKDGWTADMALTIDAESNIRDLQGEVRDYAQYFKNTEITEQQARKRGLLSRSKGKIGFVIGKSASGDLYSAFLGDKISAQKAAAIARAAPNNEPVQAAALAKADQLSPDELEQYAAILVRTKPSDKIKTTQGNLFGFDESALIEAEAVAKQIAKEQQSIKERILAVKGALRRPEVARKMGLEFSDEKSIRKEVARLENRLDELSRVSTNPKLYREMRQRAGLEEPAKEEPVAQIDQPEQLREIEQIYSDAVPPTDVPTKIKLQDAVAKALNEDAQRVINSKKKYKGVKNEQDLYDKQFADLPELFINPDNPLPEMRAAWTIATRGKGLFGVETPTYSSQVQTLEEKPKTGGKPPAKKPTPKRPTRIVSKEKFEAAKKRLTDPTKLRMGIGPQDITDLITVGAYYFESGVRAFADWSKKMVAEFGDGAKPHLETVWKEVSKEAEKPIPKRPAAKKKLAETPKKPPVTEESQLRKLRSLIHAVAEKKGLTKKRLNELKRKVAGKAISTTKMTSEQLVQLAKKVKQARPKRIGPKTVITQKTEKQIQSLKDNLVQKSQLTEKDYRGILEKVVRGRPARYIDSEHFITQTQAREIIERMHVQSEITRITEPYNQAVAKNKDIQNKVRKLEQKVKGQPKRRDPSVIESMRYYMQQAAKKTGVSDIYTVFRELTRTSAENRKTRTATIKKLEAEIPDFKKIASDKQALQRVSDYILSKSNLEGRPKTPVDITENEVKLAQRIEKILESYQSKARVSKFLNWYYYNQPIAEYDQYKTEINKARDIYDSKGFDELVKYLKTQSWGVIKSGYEPLDFMFGKIRMYSTGAAMVGKTHINIRTDLKLHRQDRTILQRLASYMRQMDLLYTMSPKINALTQLYEDNFDKFNNSKKVRADIERYLRTLKGYDVEEHPIMRAMAQLYSQAMRTIIMPSVVLGLRNLFQNMAFGHDKTILFDPRNKNLTADDIVFLETYGLQQRAMIEQYILVGEKPLFGLKHLTALVDKVKVYPWSDTANRYWAFWGKINQVRRAIAQSKSTEEMMKLAKFGDIDELEQIEALKILAKDGEDAMARYVALVYTNDVHFQYQREQRSPMEMGSIGRVLANLMLFPRAYTEKLARATSKLFSKQADLNARYRSLKILFSVIAGGLAAGAIYGKVTGRRRNPYDPFSLWGVRPGGLMLGTVEGVTRIYQDILVVASPLASEKEKERAYNDLTTAIPRAADMLIPFYDYTFRAIEASTDQKNIDRRGLRKMRMLVDKEYKIRGGAYKVQRTAVEKWQYFFAGSGVDVAIKERQKKPARARPKRGRAGRKGR